MVSALLRREAVHHLRTKGISLRRSCALAHIGRSSHAYRHRLQRKQRNQQLVDRLRVIARKYPRYGYRRAHVELCKREGRVNLKRVHRLWREAKLSLPARRSRRRRPERKEPRAIQASLP